MFLRVSLVLLLSLTGLGVPAQAQGQALVSLGSVVPVPVSTTGHAGRHLRDHGRHGSSSSPVGADRRYLAGILRRSTGFALPVSGRRGRAASRCCSPARPPRRREGYQLDVTAAVVIRAQTGHAGLFHGVQTLRQLLPAEDRERHRPARAVAGRPAAGSSTTRGSRTAARCSTWPGTSTRWPTIKRVHRPDRPVQDQPPAPAPVRRPGLAHRDRQLAAAGHPRRQHRRSAAAPGGYYTKAEYTGDRRVRRAAAHHDRPRDRHARAHQRRAGLLRRAELQRRRRRRCTPAPRSASARCARQGGHLHVRRRRARRARGADPRAVPAHRRRRGQRRPGRPSTRTFIDRVQPMVAAHGKTVIGLAPDRRLGRAAARPTASCSTGDSTTSDSGRSTRGLAGHQGGHVAGQQGVPGHEVQPTPTPLGLTWAGLIEVQTAYELGPGHASAGVAESAVLGVEAPLWTRRSSPRTTSSTWRSRACPPIAELGWSPGRRHNWDAFRQRLGAQGPRWTSWASTSTGRRRSIGLPLGLLIR